MPAQQVQIKMKGIRKMIILLRIKLFLVDIKLKRLQKTYKKLQNKYVKKYLGL